MKNQIILLAALLITLTSLAQQGINYKAVIKDSNGDLIINQSIEVRFIISKSGSSNIYIEDHPVTTDANGLIILNIGESTDVPLGDFNTIDWAADEYELQIGLDLELNGTFVYFDQTPFKMVPYALQAKKAEVATTAESANFQTINNITNNSPGDLALDDFVFGSTDLDDNTNPSHDIRMFFDKSKASFRAGRAIDNEWDGDNVGNRSVAFGLNTIASGTYSMAIGNRTKAEAMGSTAFGAYNVGGGSANSWVDTDPLFEIGNGTATINTETRNNALTVLKNGNVGIGFESENPTQALDVVGKIKVANDFAAPTPGTIRFNESNQAFEGYTDNVGWVTLGTKKPEKTIVIPASEFVETYTGPGGGSNWSRQIRYFSGIVALTSGTAPYRYILAPVILPTNSTILSISYVFEDAHSNSDLTFTFDKHCGDTTSETYTAVNVHAVSGLDGTNLFRYDYSLNEIIDFGCQYSITASTDNGWFDSPDYLTVHKIYITYKED
ncbi:MAG: hypothetical protein HKN96_10600 [Flavobacteriaceae bacterium]|nr:hypothetical protein [Flavobacteriaceae bacterium]